MIANARKYIEKYTNETTAFLYFKLSNKPSKKLTSLIKQNDNIKKMYLNNLLILPPLIPNLICRIYKDHRHSNLC